MQAILCLAITSVILCDKLDVAESIIITDETRLHRDLFNDSKQALPVIDSKGKQVKVTIGLTLNQVVDVVSNNFHLINMIPNL